MPFFNTGTYDAFYHSCYRHLNTNQSLFYSRTVPRGQLRGTRRRTRAVTLQEAALLFFEPREL